MDLLDLTPTNDTVEIILKHPNTDEDLKNDDKTPMDFVIQLLIEIFNKNINEATEITMSVHNDGKGLVNTYPLEVAEMKVKESEMICHQHGHPLKLQIEEA